MTFAGPAELTEAVSARSRRQHRAREIEHGLPNAHDLRMRRAPGHSIPRGQMTRRRRTPLALGLDEAGAAGAERTAVGVLAELGQRDAQRVDRIQHGRAVRHLDGAPIDRELHRERILMDTASSAPTRLPARSRDGLQHVFCSRRFEREEAIVAGWGKMSSGMATVVGNFENMGIPMPGIAGPLIVSLELIGGLLIFLAGPGRAAVDALWLEEDDRARHQIMERAVSTRRMARAK